MHDIETEKSPAPKRTRGKKIGKEQIEKARRKLEIYKAAKSTINATIKYNEQWFRRRYQEYFKNTDNSFLVNEAKKNKGEEVNPASAWMFNSILNYHADAMDNYPRANVLAREENDELEAAKISLILPALMDRLDFEKVYDANQFTKGCQGWCVYWVGWDKDADRGKGEIYVRKGKLLNLYWDQEVDDIQESSDVFYLHQRDRDEVIREHPHLEKEIFTDNEDGYERHEENPTNSKPNKVTVVDWYYKTKTKDGRRVVHYCQFCGTACLYATENDKELADRGLYDHGEYPFEIDVLYPLEGQVAGFGKVAISAPTQMYIDLISKATVQNALWSSRPRYFKKKSMIMNDQDFLDVRNSIVEVEGDMDNLQPIQTNRIDGNVLNLQNSMIEELRTNTGSTEVATGATPGGVTAASAIASLQEAQGKQGRASNRASFRCFRHIVTKIIELMRQFYTEEHFFRVMAPDGEMAYISMDNSGLTTGEQMNPVTGEMETYERHPVFDLEITTEKSSTYTRMQQNELMLSFYNSGMFDPRNATQSLAVIQLMDFDGKEELVRMIGQNQRVQEQLQMMGNALVEYASMIDELNEDRGVPSDYTAQTQQVVDQMMAGGPHGSQMPGLPTIDSRETAGTRKAREGAASAASPT